MNKKFLNIIILFSLILFLVIINFFPVNCLFKQLTGICCPGCGMTRAFNAILHFDFINAFFYNILSLPLFIFLIIFIVNLIIDIIKNRFNFIDKLLRLFEKYYIIIIILIILSFIYNNFNLINNK